MRLRNKVTTLLCLLIVGLPLAGEQRAGGSIEGRVTDPNGSAVVGATVTAFEPETHQTFTAITAVDGSYKIYPVPPGVYSVTVSSNGFATGFKDALSVEDMPVSSVDFKLEVATVEAIVTIDSKGGPAPNSDPIYQALRTQARTEVDFTTSATVNGLVIERHGATFRLRSGEVYFLAPVKGRVTGAVFMGEGELHVVPPTEAEKQSLKIFAGRDGTLTEAFSSLVLNFTDKTFEEIKASLQATMGRGNEGEKARELFRDKQDVAREQLKTNTELRKLADLYAPEQPGFFNAFISGKRFNKLLFAYDPQSPKASRRFPLVAPEEVLLLSYGETDLGIWTAFHRPEEYAKGTASSAEDNRVIDITHHDIHCWIKGTQLIATDRITFKSLRKGSRLVPLELFPTLRVSRVQDMQGNDLNFIQEQKKEDADLAVIMPSGMDTGKSYTITVQYAGNDALRDSGSGNFILVERARSSWYPGNANSLFGEDRATFYMTFRYPKENTLIATGAPDDIDVIDGSLTVSRWSSGRTELGFAGFNYGRFKKKMIADENTGYNVEVYTNEEVPNELKQMQGLIERVEGAGITGTTLRVISTSAMADSALANAQNSVRLYNAFFGKLPYTRIALSQQPRLGSGQAWPTLIYMPYAAFIGPTQRWQMFGIQGATHTFWTNVLPHEVAHQWWGHVIGWDSYRDQWMSEGFAQFSTSLYVQYTRGNDKFIDFWENERRRITLGSPQTIGLKPYTVGPMTQGFRLNNAKTGAVFHNLAYPKGAYVLHMIRMMMWDHKTGDLRFQTMMKDLVQTHFNQGISTEDLKLVIEKHMTREMDVDKNKTMNWFFDSWIYGTDVPAYKLQYQITSDGTFSGKLTQSGVSDKFVMVVPIYLDFGKGWTRFGGVTLEGNKSFEIPPMKLKGLKRATLCALKDVLVTGIEVTRQ